MTHILDFYFQVGTDEWTKNNRPELAHESSLNDFDEIGKELAKSGIQYQGAVVFPFPSVKNLDFRDANTLVYHSSRERLDQATTNAAFLPVYAVIPGNKESVSWLHRSLEEGLPCVGIKLWPYMGRFSLTDVLDDKELRDLIIQHNLLVMMHVGTGREIKSREIFAHVAADPTTAVQVASAAPEIDFIAAHLLRLSRTALEKAAELKNLYIDTSGLTSLGKWREGGSDGLPADDAGELASEEPAKIIAHLSKHYDLSNRLLFGSNWPFCRWWGSSVLDEASIILESEITAEEKESILIVNAARLLDQRGKRIQTSQCRSQEIPHEES